MPEIIVITFKVFVGLCAAFFIPCFLAQKLNKSLQSAYANMSQEEKDKIFKQSNNSDSDFIDSDTLTSPIYSYLPNNLYHQE